jgi:hypothetical protein
MLSFACHKFYGGSKNESLFAIESRIAALPCELWMTNFVVLPNQVGRRCS